MGDLKLLGTISTAVDIESAAAGLGVRVTELFAKLADLERRLGVVLFSRDGDMLQPTPVGVRVVALARNALSDITQLTVDLEPAPRLAAADD